jgi:hypothetical protein
MVLEEVAGASLIHKPYRLCSTAYLYRVILCYHKHWWSAPIDRHIKIRGFA